MLHLGAHGSRSRLRQVLIVKIAAIGDVVTALPMLTDLHAMHPGIKVTWVCGGIAASLVAATGLVDTLLEVDEKALFQGSTWQKIREVLRIWKKLFGKSFDLVVTAHPDPRFRLLSASVRCKEKRVFFPRPGRPRTEEYLGLILSEGEKRCAAFPALHCSLPENLESFVVDSPIALAPGGAKNLLRDDFLRRWPIEHYVEVARELIARGLPVVLVGGATDAWVRPHFSGLPVLDCIGKTTLTDLVAVLRRCHLLITHDSGPLHLAKLAPCKTIALFGPTHPYEVGTCGEEYIWGGEHLACAPCYDGKNYAPCTNNLCMKNISPAQVIKKMEGLYVRN